MTNFKVYKNIFYQFLTVIFVALVFQLINKQFEISTLYNTIENILFSMVLITPVFFINSRKIQLIYTVLSYLFFVFFIYFEAIYFHLFETYLSASSIFVALDSNNTEAFEFLRFYLDYKLIIFSVLILIVSVVSFSKFKSILSHFQKVSNPMLLQISILILTILIFLKFSTLIIYNLPYLILKSTVEYRTESSKLNAFQTAKQGGFTNVSRPIQKEDEVYVLILGESTTRSHLGLYDYYRPTTPNLESLKVDLEIYNDVISPHVHSIASITKILTLGNYESPYKKHEGSIIQLANSAGFQTNWLSNQRPIGIYESLVTKIALSSSTSKFLTTTHGRHSQVKDAALLPELDTVLLKNTASKKFIVIHLMGTHLNYENRFTDSFNQFIDPPQTGFKSKNNFKKINDYDNAVLYTDYIISEIIKKIKSLNTKSFVLYISDHGEELFKDHNMAGHNEDIATKDMFDVPFLLWQSDKYKAQKKLTIDVNRSYMLDDLFHSIADLMAISAKEVDLSRSLFNQNFKSRKRIILKSSDYDVYFNSN
jgi:heptose-I-phosphate ethanolaminephosphotransferase